LKGGGPCARRRDLRLSPVSSAAPIFFPTGPGDPATSMFFPSPTSMKSLPRAPKTGQRLVQQVTISRLPFQPVSRRQGAVMRGGVIFCTRFPFEFYFLVVTVLLPVSEFWAIKSESDPARSAKYNHGFHVEKTAFSKGAEPSFF
jgi:hypothetical protein